MKEEGRKQSLLCGGLNYWGRSTVWVRQNCTELGFKRGY